MFKDQIELFQPELEPNSEPAAEATPSSHTYIKPLCNKKRRLERSSHQIKFELQNRIVNY